MQPETSVRVHPFAELTFCPKCGNGAPPPPVDPALAEMANRTMCTADIGKQYPVDVVREAGSVPFVMPTALPFFMPTALPESMVFEIHYCAGGKELESEITDPMAQTIQMAANLTSGGKMPSIMPKRVNVCAGIFQEHLHRTCIRCRFEVLTECRDAAAAR
ncbi:MAG TPA: hypothetical protein VKW06_10330 [Candidatus Angelobacter sp.]|nr:hypothetical protein [Candidatus Angelobacter sp.]